MLHRVTTIRSRELGDALRAAMEGAGYNGKSLARQLGWSDTKLSRLLTGHYGVSELDMSALLAVCGVIGDERDRLLRLAREQDIPGWLQQHESSLPEPLKPLVNHENVADTIIAFEPVRIPGLLQTEAYARALLKRSPVVAADALEPTVAARIGRQALYNRPRHPSFTFYIHEVALRLPIGGSAVMSDQLHELLRLSVRTYITIKIVPISYGAYAAMAGACRLMEFKEIPPVVYIEEETTGLFLEHDSEIATYRRIFSALDDCALDEPTSKRLIARTAVKLYGEDSHDRD